MSSSSVVLSTPASQAGLFKKSEGERLFSNDRLSTQAERKRQLYLSEALATEKNSSTLYARLKIFCQKTKIDFKTRLLAELYLFMIRVKKGKKINYHVNRLIALAQHEPYFIVTLLASLSVWVNRANPTTALIPIKEKSYTSKYDYVFKPNDCWLALPRAYVLEAWRTLHKRLEPIFLYHENHETPPIDEYNLLYQQVSLDEQTYLINALIEQHADKKIIVHYIKKSRDPLKIHLLITHCLMTENKAKHSDSNIFFILADLNEYLTEPQTEDILKKISTHEFADPNDLLKLTKIFHNRFKTFPTNQPFRSAYLSTNNTENSPNTELLIALTESTDTKDFSPTRFSINSTADKNILFNLFNTVLIRLNRETLAEFNDIKLEQHFCTLYIKRTTLHYLPNILHHFNEHQKATLIQSYLEICSDLAFFTLRNSLLTETVTPFFTTLNRLCTQLDKNSPLYGESKKLLEIHFLALLKDKKLHAHPLTIELAMSLTPEDAESLIPEVTNVKLAIVLRVRALRMLPEVISPKSDQATEDTLLPLINNTPSISACHSSSINTLSPLPRQVAHLIENENTHFEIHLLLLAMKKRDAGYNSSLNIIFEYLEANQLLQHRACLQNFFHLCMNRINSPEYRYDLNELILKFCKHILRYYINDFEGMSLLMLPDLMTTLYPEEKKKVIDEMLTFAPFKLAPNLTKNQEADERNSPPYSAQIFAYFAALAKITLQFPPNSSEFIVCRQECVSFFKTILQTNLGDANCKKIPTLLALTETMDSAMASECLSQCILPHELARALFKRCELEPNIFDTFNPTTILSRMCLGSNYHEWNTFLHIPLEYYNTSNYRHRAH